MDGGWFDASSPRFRDVVSNIALNFDYSNWFVPEPRSIGGAIPTGTLAKFSSVLSNLLEVHVVDQLNEYNRINNVWPGYRWISQDPYFPDCILVPLEGHDPSTDTHGVMGIEVKIWYPMATELTGRLNESQATVGLGNSVLLIGAWIPNFIIWGQIETLAVGIFDILDVIRTRDNRWFYPPAALITEPRDTSERTSNLQQTNVSFWEIQSGRELASNIVELWPTMEYSTEEEMQDRIHDLLNHPNIDYRPENQNRNKIQRIGHSGIREWQLEISQIEICARQLREWFRLNSPREITNEFYSALREYQSSI